MKAWIREGYKEYGFLFFIFALWWGMFALFFILAPIAGILICLRELGLITYQVLR